MKITLINKNIDNQKEFAVATACSMCYGTKFDTIEEGIKLIRNVIKLKHLSVMENATFMFLIENTDRATSHQLVRHRIASYSQRSQRYCKEGMTDEWIDNIPSKIKANDEALELVVGCLKKIDSTYKTLMDMGINQEDARSVLPNLTPTTLTVTMNGRALYEMFEKRCCIRTQEPYRKIANEMLRLAKEDCPVLFETAGATCVRGVCNEANPCKPNMRRG